MKRREFITLLGGTAVAWPLAARAQQPALRVAGFLSSLSLAQTAHHVAAFRRGLSEIGFLEGENIAIEYRFADGQYERLTSMAADLIRRPVSVIVTAGPPAALAARTATTAVPIVFIVGLDPVAAGLVASFNKPGGNATGFSLMAGPLGQKRLELLREIVPKTSVIAMLVNPVSPDAAPEIRDVQGAAQVNRIKLNIFNASSPSDLDTAFRSLAERRADALLVGSDPFFTNQHREIATSAGRLGIPTIYPFREFAEAGGLISYGTNIARVFREAGVYAARILRGTDPADLPVVQPTTFELVVNLKTAKALGLTVPDKLLALADEVIE
jgi:putative tryptophan/tyrosine transport system substrate-binding protein